MTTTQTIAVGCGLVFALLVGVAVGGLWERRETASARVAAVRKAVGEALRKQAHDLYVETTAPDDTVRYELVVTDFGEPYGDMRYRWTLWNADAVLAVAAEVAVGQVGIDVPYMLGNAQTWPLAEAEALAWIAVARQSENSRLVLP